MSSQFGKTILTMMAFGRVRATPTRPLQNATLSALGARFNSRYSDFVKQLSEPCKALGLPERLDVKFYRASDKTARTYQQTWRDFGEQKAITVETKRDCEKHPKAEQGPYTYEAFKTAKCRNTHFQYFRPIRNVPKSTKARLEALLQRAKAPHPSFLEYFTVN